MDIPQYGPTHELRGHTDNVDGVVILPSGTNCLSVSHDQTVKLWDFSALSQLKSIKAHEDGVYGLDISRSGSMFATCSADRSVAIWDTKAMKLISRATKHEDKIYSCKFIRDDMIFTTGKDGKLYLWDIRNFKSPLKNVARPDSGPIRSVDINPDETLAFSAGHNGCIDVYNLQNNAFLYSHQVDWVREHFPADHEFFTDPKIIYNGKFLKTMTNTILTAHQDLAVRKFGLTFEGAEEQGAFVYHFDAIRHIEIAQNDAFYISACQDGTLRLWDIATNTPRHLYSGHEQIVSSVAITQDNRIAITASYDSKLNIYETHAV